MKRIVIDCLGGDNPQEELALGTLDCLDLPLSFVLVGEEGKLRPLLEEKGADMGRYEFIDASIAFPNDGDPRLLVKSGEETSLVQAMLRLNQDDAVAYIGAGSTGGVLVASIFRLGLLPGIRFPGLGCFMIQRSGSKVCLLDCGANVDMQPHLVPRFASIGSAFVKYYLGIPAPRVGLLNLGKEEHKGNAFCKAAYPLLKDSGLRFVGNIEGNDILMDKCDLVVTDGYSGNIALKAIEMTALLCEEMAQSHGDSTVAERIDARFNFTMRGASIVMGAKKLVLKVHGAGNASSIASSIRLAYEIESRGVLEGLGKEIGE